LFEVPAVDPLTLGIMATFFMAVSTVAILLPARRAAQVDPLVALRHE
jgi:ABC-type antimicrobial peptide transport system permease subunit